MINKINHDNNFGSFRQYGKASSCWVRCTYGSIKR